MSSSSRKVPYERLPSPIAAAWIAAYRAKQVLTVYRSAEITVRAMFALVLGDVLDVDWPEAPAARLTRGDKQKGLTKLAFGSRVALLRDVVLLHAGATDRVLPDLRAWWKQVEPRIGNIVRERNSEAHGAALEEEPPDAARARFADFLREATWLQQVQLVHVRSSEVRRGRCATDVRRLRGASPHSDLAHESQVAWATSVEPGYVYVGRPDGHLWQLNPFFHDVRGRSIAVLDGIDDRGRLLFVDPAATREDDFETVEGVPVPNNDWAPAAWSRFLAERKVSAAAWRLREEKPSAFLQMTASADASLRPGARVEDQVLAHLLGEGGFATVWEVEDVHSRERSALKILKPEAANDEAEARRFEEEVGLLKRLRAERCRRLLGPVESFRAEIDGSRRLVLRMPLLAATVADRMREVRDAGEALGEAQVVAWMLQTLEALEDLHARGVVHRDVKPSNLLLDDAGEIVVTDLGIARDVSRNAQLTRTGDMLGSDRYMAPEQRGQARTVDGKADVFALAATAHELLTGDVSPFPGRDIDGALGVTIRRMAEHFPENRPTAAEARALLLALGLAPAATSAATLPTNASPPVSGVDPRGAPTAPSSSDGGRGFEEWRELLWWRSRVGPLKSHDHTLDALARKHALSAELVTSTIAALRRDVAMFEQVLVEAAEDGVLEDYEVDAIEDARIEACISMREAEALAAQKLAGVGATHTPRLPWVVRALAAARSTTPVRAEPVAASDAVTQRADGTAPDSRASGDAGAIDVPASDRPSEARARSTAAVVDSAAELRARIAKREGTMHWRDMANALVALAAVTDDAEERLQSTLRAGDIFANQLNSTREATKAYEAVLSVDAANAVAIEFLTKAYETRRDFEKLYALRRRGIDGLPRGPARTGKLRELARLTTERPSLNHLEEASWRAVLDDSPDDAEALAGLEDAYRRHGNWEGYADLARRRLELEEDPQRALDLRWALARTGEDRGVDLRSIVQDYGAVLRLDASHQGAISALERMLLKADAREAAAVTLETHLTPATLIPIFEHAAKASLDPAARGDLLFRVAAQHKRMTSANLPARPTVGARAGIAPVPIRTAMGAPSSARTGTPSVAPTVASKTTLSEQDARAPAVREVHPATPTPPPTSTPKPKPPPLPSRAREPELRAQLTRFEAAKRWGDVARVLLELARVVPNRQHAVEAALRAADILANQLRNQGEAIKAFELVRELDPENVVAAEFLARAYEARQGR